MYEKGRYPSKGDYVAGTCEYTNNGYMLKIHIKESILDGKPSDVARKDIPLTIQSFGDKKVQMFDVESYQTIRYTKQK